MKAYHPPKFTVQMQAALNGEVIERRYTGTHRETRKNHGEWEVLVCKTGMYGVLRELISEFRGWEYRVKVPDRVVYRLMYRQSHHFADRNEEYAHDPELYDQFKITYDGNSDTIKSVEVLL